MVVAHEMGHWVYKHVLIFLLASSAGAWIGLYILRWQFGRVWRRLGWNGPDDVAGYPYLLGLIALLSILTLPFANGVSRFAEGQADDFAIAVSQKPEAMAAVFERFAYENLSMVEVPMWEKVIFYIHPSLNERIEKAQKAIRNGA